MKDFAMMSVSQPMPAAMPTIVGRLDAARTRASHFPLSLLELGMRVAVGTTFFRSGMNKVQSFDTAIVLFREEYRLPLLPPEIAAYLGTAVELSAPILLGLGLFARLGAAVLLAMTLVIQFLVYPANWPEHLMWASILAYVLTRGPGALSIDRAIAFNLFGRA
ncbi:DoxX family protein [Reyranella sp.]|uniref:DoxX family protein n=1 Tax=Reyranella sp. TaxID=1929291 RepID=UPI003782EEC2